MTASTTKVRHLILGTAGHIDHGKTALVQRLTGTWTDTLPEEKERGMTIDVGYAAFEMPDGTEVGLLDVPGHERLVRTMVAAATAMDLALLVVAADDGPMPQTREHVEILDVLGITELVVALTKVDLADEETVLLAEEEIHELLAPTGMAGAPIVRVSSETGAGIEDLRAVIAEAMPPAREEREEREDPYAFRMPVLRRFLVAGRGAVLTGIPVAGAIAVGDRVEVLPPGWAGRVRAIQVHHRDAEEARRGHRAALQLSDVQVDRVKRGMVIAAAGAVKPVTRVAAKVRVLTGARKSLEHGSAARAHVGADQAVVRVHVPARKPLKPGETGLVELESRVPMIAAPGDRVVLRVENASGTIGGGVVLEVLDRRLPNRRAGLIEDLLARAAHLDDPNALVLGCLKAGGDAGVTLEEVAARTALRAEGLPAVFERLVEGGGAVAVGRTGRFVHKPAFERVCTRLEEAVVRLHAKDEAVDNLPLSAVRSAMGRVEPTVLEEALKGLIDQGRLVRTPNGNVRHEPHSTEMPPEDRARCEKVRAKLAAAAGCPPPLEDLEAELSMSRPDVLRALRLLETRGEVFKTSEHWFDGDFIEQAKTRLAAHAGAHGGFTPADARTVLGSTRKWVIPLLEALDKAGFSRRVGGKRVLKTGN
jgi:selenocysteine-specific elongation factor